MKRLAKRVLRAVLMLLALALVAGLAVGAVFAVRGYNLYRQAADERPLEQMVAEIQSQETYVPFEDLPGLYVDAVVSVEDKRFWSHPGVDPIAICRALLYDIRTQSLAQGGSTISQQILKNLYFTQEKKLERKFAEVFGAFALERLCTKEEIFALYVNTIYFGSGYEGIAAAAQGYFGKEVSALDAVECVMLAGIPNAPSAYSPDASPSLTAQRTEQVLERMVACETLSERDAQALSEQTERRLGLSS